MENISDSIDNYTDNYIKDNKYTNIKQKVKVKDDFETFISMFIDWRVILFTLLTIILVLAYSFSVLFTKIKINKELFQLKDYGLKVINFSIYIIILNCFIALFTITYYFRQKHNIGKKGPKGKPGLKGQNGKDQDCDICTLKIKKFQRNEDIIDDYDLINTEVVNDNLTPKEKKWKLKNLNKFIGNTNCRNCKTTNIDVEFINGIIANYDDTITTLQYLYTDKNGNIDILDGKNGKWGNKNNKKNVTEIKCPKNSAIYKINSLYENNKSKKGINGIKGLEIFCKDIETNEPIKFSNNIIGIKPKMNSNYEYSSIKCENKNKNPSFISGVSSKYNNNIVNLGFNYCNTYK